MRFFSFWLGMLGGTVFAQPHPDPVWIEPQTGMVFVYIPAGSFMMGTPMDEAERESGEDRHKVTLSRGFYLGQTEVTQAQWLSIMGYNPSYYADCGGDCPVERVNWNHVQEFISDLQARTTGETFRLPTEAEWEYAARAGTDTPFYTGYQLNANMANVDSRFAYDGDAPGVYRGGPLPVASFPANAFGLYDMHGNVWEWCQDWFCPYEKKSVIDPMGQCESGKKAIRGGSWFFATGVARSGARYHHSPEDLGRTLGFRLVREIANQE